MILTYLPAITQEDPEFLPPSRVECCASTVLHFWWAKRLVQNGYNFLNPLDNHGLSASDSIIQRVLGLENNCRAW